MDPTVANLRRRAAESEQEAKRLREQLTHVEAVCKHAWTPVERKVRKRTEWEQDLLHPRYQGIHIEYPLRAVEKSEFYWTRTCAHCGKVEETTQTEDQVTKVPRFR